MDLLKNVKLLSSEDNRDGLAISKIKVGEKSSERLLCEPEEGIRRQCIKRYRRSLHYPPVPAEDKEKI